MNSLRLIIVDDEPLIRLGIRTGLSELDGIEIVAECETGAQAIQTILSVPADLVLLDVQMPDCDGLEVVRQVGAERMPMVIFVTAYDQYAVKAFELNAVDYLLKPFDNARLRISVERARKRLAAISQSRFADQLQSLINARVDSWPRQLVVRTGDRYEFVAVHSIDWIESANNYVLLHCGPKTHLLSETLAGVENKLNPKSFLRIHRCRIANISRMAAIHPLFNGTYQVEMCDGTRLNTGRQAKNAIQSLIRGSQPASPGRIGKGVK